jgi:hypothetical protein
MQDVIINQTIVSPQLTTAASMLICVAQPANASLHRALVKAEARLITQPWRIDAGVLTIVSHSKQTETQETDGDFCSCKTTRGVCWHRAAWLILSTLAAGGCSPVANLPLPAVLDESELPGDFLDGDFDWADDVELTAPVARQVTPRATEDAFVECDSMPLLKRGPAPFRLQPSIVIPNPLDADVDALFAEPVRRQRVKEVA